MSEESTSEKLRKKGILKPSERVVRRGLLYRQNACSIETARHLSNLPSVDFDEKEYKVLVIEDKYNPQVRIDL